MKCKLSFSGGLTAIGEYDGSGEDFTVFYSLDGDSCELRYRGGRLSETRRGAVPLRISFVRGGSSECLIGSGELTGTLPVFCRRLDVLRGKKGVHIALDYDLGGEKRELAILIGLSEE